MQRQRLCAIHQRDREYIRDELLVGPVFGLWLRSAWLISDLSGGDYCTTLTVYDSNEEGEKGAQYMIDCKTFLQPPGSDKPYTKFYREYRTDRKKSFAYLKSTQSADL